MDVVDEQIDLTTQGILGRTVACARCHDHKTDPIPTSDYYSLAGIFLSSRTLYGTFGGGHGRNASDLLALPIVGRATERLSAKEIDETKQRLAEVDSQLREFKSRKRAGMSSAGAAPNEQKNEKSRKRRSPREHERSRVNYRRNSIRWTTEVL